MGECEQCEQSAPCLHSVSPGEVSRKWVQGRMAALNIINRITVTRHCTAEGGLSVVSIDIDSTVTLKFILCVNINSGDSLTFYRMNALLLMVRGCRDSC